MLSDDLNSVLARGETLTVEFKDEVNDTELVRAVVCLANREGGMLLIGVQDDGTVIGADPRHGRETDPARLAALVANSTSPALAVTVQCHDVTEDTQIIVIRVPRAAGLTATTDGSYLRRAMDVHGKPQCLPMQPHEAMARLTQLGGQDASVLPLADAGLEDLDADEIRRFRDLARGSGNAILADLSKRDLLAALGFLLADETLTLGAVLMFGNPAAITRFAPTHETAFQVVDALKVRKQEIRRTPLVRAMQDLMTSVAPYNSEEEVEVGPFRVSLPLYAEVSLRELLANALLHRDYTRNGQVLVSIEDSTLSITNPGGFPEGVNIANLLVAPPQARNPRIADAFKRAGLVERTGRGVNRVFFSQLELGRPQPDYGRTTQDWVEVRLRAGPADKEIAAYVAESRRKGEPLALPTLQVLHEVREERRITSTRASELLQVGVAEARTVLNHLVERGLLEARGERKGRTYHLSAALYRSLGGGADYVRTRGFDRIQQEQMVMTYVNEHGSISRGDAAELCHLSPDQATRLLTRLRDESRLVMTGKRRTARYHKPPER